LITFPNCKINLGLNVLQKREDGYHELETVFYPVPWTDALEVIQSDAFEFTSEGLRIPGDKNDNICIKAYTLLKADHDIGSVKMHLQKNIPIGAGLGGGSADATFTLKVLNDLFALNLDSEQLKTYATKLGADCSFFVDNEATLARGIGDDFEKIDLDLSGKQIIVVFPKTAINTAWAYSQLKLKDEKRPTIKDIISAPIEDWKDQLVNDFEKEVVKVIPAVKEIKNSFYSDGALYASMSGSGSSVYGIFSDKVDVEKLSENYKKDKYKVFAGTLT